jgi:hypothetical protein
MPPGPPQKSGPNIALIVVIGLAILAATGLGGCLICTCIAAKSASTTPSSTGGDLLGGNKGTSASGDWITSERPFVKFIAPPGWTKNIKNDWGVFKSTDANAVFAFTTFNQPGESTARLGAAAGILGVGEVNWSSPTFGSVGKDNFSARMAEGTCNFGGPGGYIWYATVNTGTSDQILLIYTVSSRGTKAHKDAALASIRSLQRR